MEASYRLCYDKLLQKHNRGHEFMADRIEKIRKLELVKRSLALRHKLKVHDSTKAPDNHEELAALTLSRWELEDELRAIEELLLSDRTRNVDGKKGILTRDKMHQPPPRDIRDLSEHSPKH